jgi:hypothetical protein
MSLPNTTQAEDSADPTLKTKQANPAAVLSAQERETDDRVFRLYDLSKDEIKIVEDASK